MPQNIPREVFLALMGRGENVIDLPTTWATITKAIKGEEASVEKMLGQLRLLKEESRGFMSKQAGGSVFARLERLNQFFTEEASFCGNSDTYMDPAHRYLDDVLETRTGIPISLGLCFMELALGVGLHIDPIGFPGHFLVRERTEEILCDPFSGRIDLSQAECISMITQLFGREIAWDESYLAVSTKKQTVQRILNNFRNSFEGNGDQQRLEITRDLLGALEKLDVPQDGTLIN